MVLPPVPSSAPSALSPRTAWPPSTYPPRERTTGSAAPSTSRRPRPRPPEPKRDPAKEVPAPTLGQLAAYPHGSGFGQVMPAAISNGGDPTGAVASMFWSSWGGPTANGSGISDYVAPGQSVAQGSQQRATIVAFDLGYCSGHYMYQAVEWFFPPHGQTFDPQTAENICTGP